jgi:hypothetical protein
MTPERWQQIEKLYHLVLEREPGRRDAFLDEACAGDEALRREVESLLAYQGRAESFTESPALEGGAQVMGEKRIQSLIRRQIGSYKIVSLLGVGGMGEVYLAQDPRLERTIALKILPAEAGQWAAVIAPVLPMQGTEVQLFSTSGGKLLPFCKAWARARWPRDGKHLYLSFQAQHMSAFASGRTYVLPVRPGSMLPSLPAGGFRSETEVAAVPGIQVIDYGDVAPGPTTSVYAFSRETVQRNLYRIPLP